MDLGDFRPNPALARAETIPVRWYLDRKIFQLERDRIFGRCWQLICLESELSEAGDYMSHEIAGEPVVIVRGEDGELRALSNVYRHRAGPVKE